MKLKEQIEKYIPYNEQEANEKEKLRIKKDENSGVKWIEIDKATKLTNEEKMKPIYSKLNSKLKTIKIQG